MSSILIIEDEVLISKSLKMLIEQRGHSVTCVLTGQEALSLIKENNYDKIICDLMLKDITGFDIIEECKKHFSAEKISTLFTIITAYSSKDVILKANSYGCNLVNKPFLNINSAIDDILS